MFGILTGGLFMAACHLGRRDERVAKGRELAAKYCGSCHRFPTPDLLDRKSWMFGVLPQMGPRLGVFSYRNERYPSNAGDPNVGRGFYPAKPLVTPEEWGEIVGYYATEAADSLPPQHRDVALRPDTTRFSVEAPVVVSSATPPATDMVRYVGGAGGILTSDFLSHTLDVWDGKLRRTGHFLIGGSIVDLSVDSAGADACNIGPFGPNNARAGHVDRLSFPVQGIGAGHLLPIVGDSLMRPVSLAEADLNGDGRRDIVVCEFGFIKGELAWLENEGGGHYRKHVLRSIAGAIHAVVQDYNHDGLPDLWVLFAQGDEGILRYTNEGHGRFSEEEVLRFPPCYGSTYFELDDLDKDGNPDILYTCGDNGDYSQVLKPYHGVYIFMNDGRGHFNQRYFFPINGCYRAMARDMDGDGDMDIAAIAFFADYVHEPQEGFVYLENEGSWKYVPYTIPGTEAGRWISMDIADVDGDGKPDILLGNCSVGPVFSHSARDWKKGPALLLLHNRSK